MGKSQIGLPKGISVDDAYVQGLADGEKVAADSLAEYAEHQDCAKLDGTYDCTCGLTVMLARLRGES